MSTAIAEPNKVRTRRSTSIWLNGIAAAIAVASAFTFTTPVNIWVLIAIGWVTYFALVLRKARRGSAARG